MRYNEIITELFNKSADMHFTATDDDLYLANFEVGDGVFTIRAWWRDLLKCWEIEFKRNGDYEATNTGGQFEVFATALEFINKFVARYNPEKFRFGASMDEPTRVKLYDRMARSVNNNPNYEMSIAQRAQFKYYVFTKKQHDSLDETQVVNELFDAPVKWSQVHKDDNDYLATFKIGKLRYNVACDYHRRDGAWDISFELNRQVGITGTGNEIAVFATMKSIVAKFLKLYNPTIIQFSANMDEPSRVRLYARMAKQIGTTFGYKLSSDDVVDGHKTFRLYQIFNGDDDDGALFDDESEE